MSDYKSEFPDYDDTLIFPAGWEDISWHNDACPSFIKVFGDVTFRIYCDYKDMQKRDCPDWTRFGVYIEDLINFECVAQFETLHEALAYIDQQPEIA
jgi:hypothetical protein